MTVNKAAEGVAGQPGGGLEAVILAAGRGSRLLSPDSLPKPALPLDGRPLIVRILDGLVAAGVARAHIVTGFGARALVACPGIEREGLEVNWVHNERFDEPNGVSLSCVRGAVGSRFLVSMADHVFEHEVIRRFAASVPRGSDCLAVDRKIQVVFDLDDATRVMTRDGAICAIGKGLEPFDAIDTGLFLLTPRVFDALEESSRAGDRSLSGGIRRLAAQGLMLSWDIGDGRWLDVDTPEAFDEAVRLLRAGIIGR
jgi:choline kinase